MTSRYHSSAELPPFDRQFFASPTTAARIGGGALGGKAAGLLTVRDLLAARLAADEFPGVEVYVPRLAVLGTDVFDAFLERNRLDPAALAQLPDDQLALEFQRADLPAEVLGDLRALAEGAQTPLAVRSSSLLEDALFRPFAGVYETKMVANNEPEPDRRFDRLVAAVKLVYASTFFRAARSYAQAAHPGQRDEKMAVVIQEVVGARHGPRFYPEVSGVARSFHFFPIGDDAPEDGVVNLALGLGMTIVDGGVSWIYSPARPTAPAPFGSVRDLLKATQLRFWAVNMGDVPVYDPIAAAEYLVESHLETAEYDGVLAGIASTYDAGRDRLVPGTGVDGPRVLDFAPLLDCSPLPINDVIRRLLALGAEALGEAVEIEFAITFPSRSQARLAVLQMRPMLVPEESVDLDETALEQPGLLCASPRVLGNGVEQVIRDIVYVRRDTFEARLTRQVALQVDDVNRTLMAARRPYLLIGFGRWGSSDPWLGVPVVWGQIAGVRTIVESTAPGMDVEPSQGAHFFHNLIGFQVGYFSVRHNCLGTGWQHGVDWQWLDRQPAFHQTELLRHIRVEQPLRVMVDGRKGRGAIWHA
jgi:hypothetical protein